MSIKTFKTAILVINSFVFPIGIAVATSPVTRWSLVAVTIMHALHLHLNNYGTKIPLR